MSVLTPYLVAMTVSFVSVFLKGIQYKNVNENMYRAVFVTSYAMAICDVAVVGMIVKSGWSIAVATGFGASVGMLASMWLHNRFIKRG